MASRTDLPRNKFSNNYKESISVVRIKCFGESGLHINFDILIFSVREYPDNLNLGDLQCMMNFIYCVLSKYSITYSGRLTQA